MRKQSEESKQKRFTNKRNNEDKKEISKQKQIEKIKQEARGLLLPSLQEKVKELTDLILNKIDVNKNTNNIQIMSMIAKASTLDNFYAGNISYTPQELRIGFDLYLEMINKINDVKPFPPTIESFTAFMGMSRVTYNNYLVDPERRDTMEYIHSYLLGVLATGSLVGELKEISSIYLQKSMGKVEQVQPIVVEHKKVENIDDIKAKLESLKKDNIIEATYEEDSNG